MGIAWLLLQRTFGAKPRRTLLFLLGYALATAVMVTLLAVGEAVLQQARDKDLLGGGDLILVPQGIDLESMKVGGMSALYYSIPQARFIVRQVLNSSRFENEIDTVSPYIVPKLLYIRHAGTQAPPLNAFAEGSLPEQENRMKKLQLPWHNRPEDDAWIQPESKNFYHEIDHFHLPTVDSPDMRRWAEWHYFNFESPRFYGYLSFMAAGDILAGQAEWIVSLQLYDDTSYRNHSAKFPLNRDSLPLQRIDYRAGPNHVRYVKDHYEIELDFNAEIPVKGRIRYFPVEGLYFPPSILAKKSDFESGYVIPAIRGKYEGTIQVGNRTYDFNGLDGYHDHNWGIWRQTQWNWGHAYSKDFAIFFGEIYVEGKSKGLFAGVYDSKGFLTVFRPDGIEFSDYEKNENRIIPRSLKIQAQKRFASLSLTGEAERYITSPVQDSSLDFVQYKMNYDIVLTIDGRQHNVQATGNAETFVKSTVIK